MPINRSFIQLGPTYINRYQVIYILSSREKFYLHVDKKVHFTPLDKCCMHNFNYNCISISLEMLDEEQICFDVYSYAGM